MSSLRMLILGTGAMAHNHARAFAQIPGVELVAAVDTRPEPLDAFCDTHGIVNRFTSLQEALAWGEFDAATNVTPDAAHYATTLPLLQAAKHVLCEKPLAVHADDAKAMAEAAQKAGVINMINMSYRNLPEARQAAKMVAEGQIGSLRHFEASYLQSWLAQPAWGDWRSEKQWLWRLSSAHGSKGVLGDVGIHILDFTTFIAGARASEISCQLATFAKAPGDQIDEYRLDANDSAAMILRLQEGALGSVVATRFASGHLNDLKLRLYGDQGGLEVTLTGGVGQLRACLSPDLQSAQWHDIACPPVTTLYEEFIEAIRSGKAVQPDFARGAELQIMLDQAEASAKAEGKSLAL